MARQVSSSWRTERARRAWKVFWATGWGFSSCSQVFYCYSLGRQGRRLDRERVGLDSHAQPTHRRKTTRTGPPRPHTIFLSLSSGASSPTLGSSATGIGGWGGASHGWTVMGRALTDIQAGHGEPSSAGGAGSCLEAVGGLVKLKVSEESPAFLRTSLVERLENMAGSLRGSCHALDVEGTKGILAGGHQAGREKNASSSDLNVFFQRRGGRGPEVSRCRGDIHLIGASSARIPSLCRGIQGQM